MRENVLMTGSTGFIGSHVVDRLVSYGYYVKIIDNLSTQPRSVAEFIEFTEQP